MKPILASARCVVSIVLATTILAPTFTVALETTAFAQPKKKPLREQLPPEAQKHWDTALALYQRNQWDGARTSFNAAYEASKNPRVLFNVAVCDKNLNKFARAIEIFKRELVEGAGQLTPDEAAMTAACQKLSKNIHRHLKMHVISHARFNSLTPRDPLASKLAAPCALEIIALGDTKAQLPVERVSFLQSAKKKLATLSRPSA